MPVQASTTRCDGTLPTISSSATTSATSADATDAALVDALRARRVDADFGSEAPLPGNAGVWPCEYRRLNIAWTDIAEADAFTPLQHDPEKLPGFKYLWVTKGVSAQADEPRLLLGFEVSVKECGGDWDVAADTFGKVLAMHGVDSVKPEDFTAMLGQGHPSLLGDFAAAAGEPLYDAALATERPALRGEITGLRSDDGVSLAYDGFHVKQYGAVRMGGELVPDGSGGWLVNNASGRTSAHREFTDAQWEAMMVRVAGMLRTHLGLKVAPKIWTA